MAPDLEPSRRELVHRRQATLQLEHPAARVALEMVVMSLTCYLVNRLSTGEVDGCQPALLQERLDVAVNGGDAKTAHLGLRQREQLRWG